jgi:nitroreductase
VAEAVAGQSTGQGAAVLDALLARRSVPAEALTEPGPDDAQVAQAIDAALRAPDHGRMQPWRFRLVRTRAAREAFSGVLGRFADGAGLPPAQADKLRRRPLVAPLVIVVSAKLKEHPKVPEIEQLFAVAAGTMNLLNAFHAQGFGAVWLTGPASYDAGVAAALGLVVGTGPDERLLGFVYVGTPGPNVPPAPARPAREGFVGEWQG